MPKRGEIWSVNLDPTRGAEIRKTRPAVVVSADELGRLPLRIIVPITEWKHHYARNPWMVHLGPDPNNGLTKPSTADAFQIRSVSTLRLVRQLGTVTAQQLDEIAAAIAISVAWF